MLNIIEQEDIKAHAQRFLYPLKSFEHDPFQQLSEIRSQIL